MKLDMTNIYICVHIYRLYMLCNEEMVHQICFWIISRTSSMICHALWPPTTSSFHSLSFHSCMNHNPSNYFST